jgi:hypothetical protein
MNLSGYPETRVELHVNPHVNFRVALAGFDQNRIVCTDFGKCHVPDFIKICSAVLDFWT